MHECPQCWQVCYCDLDDSNDCRDDGECFHECEPEEDEYAEVLGDLRDGNRRSADHAGAAAPGETPNDHDAGRAK